MLSRSTCVSSCRLLIAALALSLAAGCAVDVDEPLTDEAFDEAELTPAGDEGEVDEPSLAEAVPPAELALADECTNDAGCPQGSMCVKPAFKANYCAALCVYDGLGEHNCPPGFDCTRPLFWNRYRCTPD
jgi:hypothetical protein